MNAHTQKTALITGASGGIGLALAREFGAHGYQIVAVGSDERRLEQAAKLLESDGISVVRFVQDLSVSGAAGVVVSYLDEHKIVVDVLVNNAGFATAGPFSETDFEEETREMNLNMVCLTQLTKCLLPGMITRHSGQVLNVSSVAGFYPGPYMAVYFATKAYVLHFSEALAVEFRGSGVTVTALCPGPTESGFAKRAGFSTGSTFDRKLPSAASVAEAGFRGCMRGDRIVIPGLRNRIMIMAGRFAPRSFITSYLARTLR
jgi:short-subunit dehydrogenase